VHIARRKVEKEGIKTKLKFILGCLSIILFGMLPTMVQSAVTMNVSPPSGTLDTEIYIQIRGIGSGPSATCYLYWDENFVREYQNNKKSGLDYGFDIQITPSQTPNPIPGYHTIKAQLAWVQTGNGFDEAMTKTLTGTYLITQTLPTTGTLKVFVRDDKGSLQSGINVASTSQPAGQTSLNAVTDSSGSVEFKAVQAGSYSFMASKSGYDSGFVSVSTVVTKTSEATIVIKQTVIQGPQVPGFPIESMALGVLISLALLISYKHMR
jgi:hypothetical protein